MKLSVFEGIVALVSTIYSVVGLIGLVAFGLSSFAFWGDPTSDLIEKILMAIFLLLYLVIIYFAFRIGSKKLMTWKLKEKIITVICAVVGFPISFLILFAYRRMNYLGTAYFQAI